MTNNQMFFSMAGLMITLFIAGMGFFKYYLDAKLNTISVKFDTVNAKFATVDTKFDGANNKLDHISSQVDMLVTYMIEHHGRIATLEERTKNI